jgi:laminin beta 1
MQGVETLQCNKTNGECICLKGIVGTRCDKCARGTRGKAPLCIKCGECFDNWDSSLNSIKGILNIIWQEEKYILKRI